MKKFIFAIAAVAAMTLASCSSVTSNKDAVEESISADSTEVLTDTTAVAVDSVATDTEIEVVK